MAAITAAVTSVVSAGVGMISANQRKQAANGKARQAAKKLARLEANRQAIVNPYENMKDLSSMISNPFADLGVATQAAEMQAEEADIALANTLDTIRETGSGAGGATALAQMALKSKKGVSASIEAQEAQNEKLKAQGEQQMEQLKMSEAQRMQQAEASGKSFVFNARETREVGAINRVAGQQSQAEQQAAQATADSQAALIGGIGALGSAVGAFSGME